MDRVAERFHRERVLFETSDAVKIRDPSERDYQVVVLNLMRMMRWTMHHLNPLGRKIDAPHLAVKKLDLAKQFTDGIDYMGDVDITRGNLVQHGREQKKVFAVYERRFYVREPRQRAFEVQRRVEAGKHVCHIDVKLADRD